MKNLVITELDGLEIDLKILKKSLREIRDSLRSWQYDEMRDYGVAGGGMKWEDFGVDKELVNFESSLLFVSSWGIVHHRDYTGFDLNVLIPLDVKHWNFKFTDAEGRERESFGSSGYTVFDQNKIHSLAPKKAVRKPFIAAVIEFNKKKTKKEE